MWHDAGCCTGMRCPGPDPVHPGPHVRSDEVYLFPVGPNHKCHYRSDLSAHVNRQCSGGIVRVSGVSFSKKHLGTNSTRNHLLLEAQKYGYMCRTAAAGE